MTTLNRRRFVQLGGLGATALGLGAPSPVYAQGSPQRTAVDDDRVVRLRSDGLGLSPSQYSRLLAQLADEMPIASDSYVLGGVVEELEAQFARVLGKEQAIFMPTGTLANHMAVRALAGGPSRVLVQSESHLYQDEGDCAQTLSGLTLIPLATGAATFTADDVQRVLNQTQSGRVGTRVSVISIETPVRRRSGERFDPAQLNAIVTLARRSGIKLHLDGARLFLQAAYTGESVAEAARPFDTVYVSLYKYFNAASGAILAGPRDVLGDMVDVRRMFGGGLAAAWPFAAIALHYLPGFVDRFSQAVKTSEELIRNLQQHEGFSIERVPLGTNLFRVKLASADPAAFERRMVARRILLNPPQRDTFLVAVNESINRTTTAALSEAFVRSLAG
jgi:threonine aldolase